ncbi:MAG: hypothetical protein IKC94_05590 [Lentisphaeria bacterium]|nr:hypothetical protein [Lentisphaeria bacterium]
MSSQHDLLGKRAFELLPSWEREFWAEEKENIPQYCFYPDLHLVEQWGSPEKLKFYEKYCLMPNGKCTPHGPTGADWMGAAFAGELSTEPFDYTLHYYCPLIIDLIKKGDRAESAAFAGTLAHFLQDCCLPVHSMNNIIINQLYPPANGKYFFYHRLFDSAPFDPESVDGEPELLGFDLTGLIYTLREKCFYIIEKNISVLPEFIHAVKSGDEEAVGSISQAINRQAITLTAACWHTLFMIATGKITAGMVKNSGKLDLTSLPLILSSDAKFDRQQFIDAGIPFYKTVYTENDPCRARLSVNPYPFEPAVNYAYDGSGNVIPLALQINGSRQQSDKGIAVGTYGIASFRVDGRIFSELEVYAGVHYCNDFDGEVTFAIWCYETTSPLMARKSVSRKQDALHFKIALPAECRTISLLSSGGNGKSSAIWFDPQLSYRQ